MRNKTDFIRAYTKIMGGGLVWSFLVLLTFSASCLFGDYAYVSNLRPPHPILVIDTDSNTLVDTIPFSGNPYGITASPDGTKVYAANNFSNSYVIDTASNTSTTIPNSQVTFFIAISPDGSKAYATTSGNSVLVIDTASNTVIHTIAVGARTDGIAITPDGTKAYVTNNLSTSIYVIDIASNAVTQTITVGSSPQGIAITPDGTKAYVTNNGGNTVSVIDIASGNVTAITVGISPTSIAITPDGTKAYVTNSHTVSVIETATNAVSTINSGLGDSLNGIAITPDGTKAYVANNSGFHSIFVIDTASNTVSTVINLETSQPFYITILPLPSVRNLGGAQKKNSTGLVFELVNVLSWSQGTAGTRGYCVYRNGTKIATLNAGTLSYRDHHQNKGVTTSYSVTAINSFGNEGAPASIQIP